VLEINDDNDINVDCNFEFLNDIISPDPLKCFGDKTLTLIDGFSHKNSKFKFEGDINDEDVLIPAHVLNSGLHVKSDKGIGLNEGIRYANYNVLT
jgi:hypothetical protein